MRFHTAWWKRIVTLGFIVAGCGIFFVGDAIAQNAPAFQIVKTVPLGTPDKWDYLSYDDDSQRVFLAHDTEITVLDGATGAIVGRVDGLTKAHGVTFVGHLHRGYATNNGRVTVFDLGSLRPLTEIVTDAGADAILYDPVSDRVFVMNGKAETVTAIDPGSNAVIKTIPVGGKPEFAAVDGQGGLYINVEDTNEIIRLDTKAVAVTGRWTLSQCEAPHGLAIDPQSHRLFASCVNAKMVVVDANDGAVKAFLPIGKGSDAVVFDTKRQIAFSSNGDGTLSMIAENGDGGVTALPALRTVAGARTMTLDRQTGRIFLVAGDVSPTARSIVPGSLKLLILDAR